MQQDHHIRKKNISSQSDEDVEQEKTELGKGVGEKLQEGYVEEISDRVITFGEQKVKKRELNLIGDKGAYASTYIRLVNGILAHRLERIKKIKEMDKNFDECIRLLQSDSSENFKFDKISTNLVGTQEIKEGMQCLILQKGIAEIELELLTNSFNLKTKELRIQEMEIMKKRNEIQNTSRQFGELNKKIYVLKSSDIGDNKNTKFDPVKTINDELELLSKKHDVQKLSRAIEGLISYVTKNR